MISNRQSKNLAATTQHNRKKSRKKIITMEQY